MNVSECCTHTSIFSASINTPQSVRKELTFLSQKYRLENVLGYFENCDIFPIKYCYADFTVHVFLGNS